MDAFDVFVVGAVSLISMWATVVATVATVEVILHRVPHRKANALRCRAIRAQHKLARIRCTRCGLPRTTVRETQSAIALCDC